MEKIARIEALYEYRKGGYGHDPILREKWRNHMYTLLKIKRTKTLFKCICMVERPAKYTYIIVTIKDDKITKLEYTTNDNFEKIEAVKKFKYDSKGRIKQFEYTVIERGKTFEPTTNYSLTIDYKTNTISYIIKEDTGWTEPTSKNGEVHLTKKISQMITTDMDICEKMM